MKLADIKSNLEVPTGEYQAGRAPTATDDINGGHQIGCNWIDVTADKAYICVDNLAGAAVWRDITASGSGEANTGSNIGTGGVGVYHSKSGVDLRFKKINAGSARASITDDAVNNEVDIDVVEASIVHQNLSGAGTNTHATIDSHIANTSNPHSVTANQVLPSQTGNSGKYLTTNGTNTSWSTISGGGSWTTSVVTADVTNNTSTLVDVAGLSFTTLANTQYTIRLRVFGTSTANGDYKYQLTHAGTTTRVRRIIQARCAPGGTPAEVATGTAFDAAAVAVTGTGAGTFVLYEDIILQVGASGGVLKLQFAQNTADAGPTQVFEGSYIEYAVS